MSPSQTFLNRDIWGHLTPQAQAVRLHALLGSIHSGPVAICQDLSQPRTSLSLFLPFEWDRLIFPNRKSKMSSHQLKNYQLPRTPSHAPPVATCLVYLVLPLCQPHACVVIVVEFRAMPEWRCRVRSEVPTPFTARSARSKRSRFMTLFHAATKS